MSGYKMSQIWNFFERLKSENNGCRALCKLCGSTFSLGGIKLKAQNAYRLKQHLRACHKGEFERYVKQAQVCHRKNPVWNFFEKMKTDRSKALCKVCGKALSLGSIIPRMQSAGGLRRHLKARHKDQHELLLAADYELEQASKQIKQEHMEMDCPEIFDVPNAADSAMMSETVNHLLHWYENGVAQDEDYSGALFACLSFCMCCCTCCI